MKPSINATTLFANTPFSLWGLIHSASLALLLQAPSHAEQPLPAIDCLVEPYQTIDLSTAVTGIIQEVTVDRGDRVAKNQIVALLHSDVEKTLVELAEIRSQSTVEIELRKEKVSFTKRNKSRLLDLSKKNMVSLQEKDAAETEWRLSKRELSKAREQRQINKLEHVHAVASLAQRTITSPVDGVVVKRFLSTGEYVENRPIVRIAQINPLRVTVVAPVALFGRISLGDQASIKLETNYSRSLTAKVIMVDKVIDAASGTYVIRLELVNEDNAIPSGLSCQARF
ncbi:MAG: RND family efflux transporter MFP subunit [Cellvibrionaceae bacterium]